MTDEIFDLIVLGASPGGYVGAIRAAQLDLKVAVVESRPTLGGVCLNEGCIPSKALLDSSEHFALARDKFDMHGIEIPTPKLNLAKMMERKSGVVSDLTGGIAYLFQKNGIRWIKGTGKLLGAEVSVVEMLPKSDADTTQALQRSLKKQGMSFHMGTCVESIEVSWGKARVKLVKGDKVQELVCDKVLMSIGRKPNLDRLSADEVGIDLDERGSIKVDSKYMTSVPGIYANF